jgi:small subunit ribosomal protein S8
MNYPIGDFLIRIKNASLAKKRQVKVASTRLISSVACALKKQGYLREVVEKDGQLTAFISYRKKQPLIMNVRLISKPGLRVYKKADELEKIKKPTTLIVSTSKGVMSSREAIKKRLGGEVIVEML